MGNAQNLASDCLSQGPANLGKYMALASGALHVKCMVLHYQNYKIHLEYMVLAFTRPQNLIKYMVLALSKPQEHMENTWFWLSKGHKVL